MNILKNKYFILGNLLLILISIPVTLFFIRQQQEIRSRAAPSSKLYFTPANPNTSIQCAEFNVKVMVDPGQNIVSIVDFAITYDSSKLEVSDITESSVFSTVVRSANISPGNASISLSVGADVTKAVQTVSEVATITFKPLEEGTAQIQFDSSQTKVLSLSTSDSPTENVLLISSLTPANTNISSNACTTGQSVTQAPNAPPICSSLTVSPDSSGTVPFSVNLKAEGNDTDGTITKATFVFGDGNTQDTTSGLNVASASAEISHTYQTAGNYTATATFTDDDNTVSQSCSFQITALAASQESGGSGGGSVSSGETVATPTATSAPEATIAPTGSAEVAIGIALGLILTISAGIILLAL